MAQSNSGLAVNDGVVVILSSETGRVKTILLDEGWLTGWRTAAAGALAALVTPTRGHKSTRRLRHLPFALA